MVEFEIGIGGNKLVDFVVGDIAEWGLVTGITLGTRCAVVIDGVAHRFRDLCANLICREDNCSHQDTIAGVTDFGRRRFRFSLSLGLADAKITALRVTRRYGRRQLWPRPRQI
jgi:hypothetical protein